MSLEASSDKIGRSILRKAPELSAKQLCKFRTVLIKIDLICPMRPDLVLIVAK